MRTENAAANRDRLKLSIVVGSAGLIEEAGLDLDCVVYGAQSYVDRIASVKS